MHPQARTYGVAGARGGSWTTKRKSGDANACRTAGGAVADDDGHHCGDKGACRIEHVRDDRPSGERMQDLGHGGAHALAQPGGKHDDMNRGGHAEAMPGDLDAPRYCRIESS